MPTHDRVGTELSDGGAQEAQRWRNPWSSCPFHSSFSLSFVRFLMPLAKHLFSNTPNIPTLKPPTLNFQMKQYSQICTGKAIATIWPTALLGQSPSISNHSGPLIRMRLTSKGANTCTSPMGHEGRVVGIIPGRKENQTDDEMAKESPHVGYEELTVVPGGPE